MIELTAPLVPLYTAAIAGPSSPATEPMLITLPPSGGNILIAAFVASKRPITLTSNMAAMLSTVMSSSGAKR